MKKKKNRYKTGQLHPQRTALQAAVLNIVGHNFGPHEVFTVVDVMPYVTEMFPYYVEGKKFKNDPHQTLRNISGKLDALSKCTPKQIKKLLTGDSKGRAQYQRVSANLANRTMKPRCPTCGQVMKGGN